MDCTLASLRSKAGPERRNCVRSASIFVSADRVCFICFIIACHYSDTKHKKKKDISP